ncbi:hypothetical protein SAMD00019534_038470 [Acytostelium subglobosum LB1]|uniref:hypothetical protein n=1 Tax=Acytostelium subglobosum LB1 TaxID=1410327 RepID=UPI0006450513|nr:hypothetical protein SAMD00019534_038470 [Acytostelium subglobosum LB1]GAM20672.1 hypothetical protein SAMD00019534_038470 [Acytostelium subglobosum LB1]|eukprot:XP_012760193.1 hypothetical protein SAMD00019534_038470 [Acytostelium subglobosum LB1]
MASTISTTSLLRKTVDFNQKWDNLSNGMSRILSGLHVSGFDLAQDVYDLCVSQPHPHSEPLYDSIKKFFENHVDQLREAILTTSSDTISEYLKQWEKYSLGSQGCNVIFRYLVG